MRTWTSDPSCWTLPRNGRPVRPDPATARVGPRAFCPDVGAVRPWLARARPSGGDSRSSERGFPPLGRAARASGGLSAPGGGAFPPSGRIVRALRGTVRRQGAHGPAGGGEHHSSGGKVPPLGRADGSLGRI